MQLRLPLIAAYFRKTWVHAAAVAVAGFIVHLPALQGQPIWDDDFLIRTNPFIKSPLLIFEAFRHHLFLESYSSHYRPVQNLSYMADYFFWNNNLYGFHLSSVLFHVGSAVLLYFLLRRLLKPLLVRCDERKPASDRHNLATLVPLVAFLAALLWVVHPVHSAAVDYVSGRADSLALFFACSAWLLFLKAREISGRAFRYTVFALAGCCGLLSLCSRENACVLMTLFLLNLFGFDKSMTVNRKFVVLVACLSLLSIYAGLRCLPGRTEQSPSQGWNAPTRATLMARSLGDYGRLMVLPINLHMERTVFSPRTSRNESGWRDSIPFEYLSIIGLLMIAAFAFGAFRPGIGQHVRIFGAAWFLFAYLPISNLIELNATVAEHWLYVPSIGLLIFLAGVALALPISWRRASVALACCAVIAFGIRSTFRSSDWVSEEIFAQRTMAAGGTSARIALLLGQTHLNRKEYAEAEILYRKVLQICPDHPIARNNLADVLEHLGKKEEAKTVFVAAANAAPEARKNYPRTWMPAMNLARAYHDDNDDVRALAVLQKALQEYPDTWALISLESELMRRTNRLDESLAKIHAFAQDNRWHYAAWLALGRLYAEKDSADLAAAALRHASWLDIHDTQALNLIALIRLNQNQLEEACAAQRTAVSRQPDEPRQYVILSNILDKMGRGSEANAELAKASRLRALADNVVVN